MKIIAYNVLPFEQSSFIRFEQEMNIDITIIEEILSMKNVHLAEGYDAVTVLGHSHVTQEVLNKLHTFGITSLSTRTIGYDHIDINAAKQLSMSISNARYAPYNVADFTIMLMLMLLRKTKVSICRALVNDFSLDGLQGREIRSLTIGIMGTGRIGQTVIENLSGFGCKILAYDQYENEAVKSHAQYVDLNTLYKESDIVSLHMPLTDENYHIINKDSIKQMKKNVLLINTARGALIDSEDLIAALESGWVGGAGIDTLEEEEGVVHRHIGTEIIDKRTFFYIKQFPNVILTQHYAFFTEEATSSMVECGLLSLKLDYEKRENPYRVV